MSKDTITIYRCDFCRDEIRGIYRGWFEIFAGEELKAHACHECGVAIRHALNDIDIPPDFHCTEYDDKESGFGWIKIAPQDTRIGIIFAVKRQSIINSYYGLWLT